MSEVGLSLDDLRGRTEVEVTERPRNDVVAQLRRWLPFIDDPDPVREVARTHTPGMSRAEVVKWLSYHSEREEYKQEQQERAQNRAQRKSNPTG